MMRRTHKANAGFLSVIRVCCVCS